MTFSFFHALAAADYTKVCSDLTSSNREQLQVYLQGKHRDRNGCTMVIPSFLHSIGSEARRAADGTLSAVRVHGDTAFVLFRPQGGQAQLLRFEARRIGLEGDQPCSWDPSPDPLNHRQGTQVATRISCIIPHPHDPDNRISGVGGLFGWTEWEVQIIGEIEDGANYYVEIDDHERLAVVVGEGDGRKYLTTDPDHSAINHLLSLPHCP